MRLRDILQNPKNTRKDWMAALNRGGKPYAGGKLWTVKVRDVKGLDLSFNSRKEAREYKRLLQGSRRQLEAKIVLQETFDGYLVDTETS